jgi:hypothetical protein
MARNQIGQYVWLIHQFRRNRKLTFEEISQSWRDSPYSYGEPMAKRTFHHFKEAITEIFGLEIKCDRHDGYLYYLDGSSSLMDNSLSNWLINSFTTFNQLSISRQLQPRIQFEDVPSGHQWLTELIEAMKENHVVRLTYKGFSKSSPNTFDIEPYGMKVFRRRWYVIARSPYYDKVMIYALDRIVSLDVTMETFGLPEDFSLDDYFDGFCGIIAMRDISVEHVVVKASKPASDYIESLPLHQSQRVKDREDESVTFEYDVSPTFDFLQSLMMQADMVEVLEPQWVRDEMNRIAKNLVRKYDTSAAEGCAEDYSHRQAFDFRR